MRFAFVFWRLFLILMVLAAQLLADSKVSDDLKCFGLGKLFGSVNLNQITSDTEKLYQIGLDDIYPAFVFVDFSRKQQHQHGSLHKEENHADKYVHEPFFQFGYWQSKKVPKKRSWKSYFNPLSHHREYLSISHGAPPKNTKKDVKHGTVQVKHLGKGDRLFKPMVYFDVFGDFAGLDFAIERRDSPAGGFESWVTRHEAYNFLDKLNIEFDFEGLDSSARIIGAISSMGEMSTGLLASLQFIYEASTERECALLSPLPSRGHYKQTIEEKNHLLVNSVILAVSVTIIVVVLLFGYFVERNIDEDIAKVDKESATDLDQSYSSDEGVQPSTTNNIRQKRRKPIIVSESGELTNQRSVEKPASFMDTSVERPMILKGRQTSDSKPVLVQISEPKQLGLDQKSKWFGTPESLQYDDRAQEPQATIAVAEEPQTHFTCVYNAAEQEEEHKDKAGLANIFSQEQPADMEQDHLNIRFHRQKQVAQELNEIQTIRSKIASQNPNTSAQPSLLCSVRLNESVIDKDHAGESKQKSRGQEDPLVFGK